MRALVRAPRCSRRESRTRASGKGVHTRHDAGLPRCAVAPPHALQGSACFWRSALGSITGRTGSRALRNEPDPRCRGYSPKGAKSRGRHSGRSSPFREPHGCTARVDQNPHQTWAPEGSSAGSPCSRARGTSPRTTRSHSPPCRTDRSRWARSSRPAPSTDDSERYVSRVSFTFESQTHRASFMVMVAFPSQATEPHGLDLDAHATALMDDCRVGASTHIEVVARRTSLPWARPIPVQ